MGKSRRSVTDLARRVAELQDRAPEAKLDRERGRARLLAADLGAATRDGSARRRGASLSMRVVAALAAALVVASIAIGFAVRPRASMGFELGTIAPGVVGEWIAAPPSAELPIRFSDGSLLRLAPGGRARVASVAANGAEIALERGSLDLAVVHRDQTRWLVRVGPFQIHVVGTRFETSWDPVTEQFSVALREGAITVSGPVVGDARVVRAGERLTVSTATSSVEVGSIEARVEPLPSLEAPSAVLPSALASSAPSAPARTVDLDPVTPRATTSSDAPGPIPREAPGWAALARDAKYKDALAAAEREGFDTICTTASARDLHALADAARLGGSSARAAQAFNTLRARFPGSPDAAAAAFILGRIAQDQSHDYAGAAGWYTRYLGEQPGGAFAADAAGRLVEVEDKMGDESGARRAAARYLAAYPKGAHAAYATSVIERGSSPIAPANPGPILEPQAP
jgi:TolA-binding protein